ncbi:hypothetical protein GCM10010428_30210 [Actinosynnema pretiosum subsp. pretiosum]
MDQRASAGTPAGGPLIVPAAARGGVGAGTRGLRWGFAVRVIAGRARGGARGGGAVIGSPARSGFPNDLRFALATALGTRVAPVGPRAPPAHRPPGVTGFQVG